MKRSTKAAGAAALLFGLVLASLLSCPGHPLTGTRRFGMGLGGGLGLGSGGANAPSVLTVSQNGGTTSGGSSVNVTGANFIAGMTSALGTVSAITATTATITTNAHAAGAFSWTLTDLVGTSTLQTYTYLAAPGTPSSVPASGPSGSTQAATFTSTNLPFGLSGVPFAITVGGNVVTGLSASASTIASGTIPTHAAGAADIVVSVDGVTATGSGAYTFIDPLVVSTVSQNAGKAAGGSTVNITGTGFVGGMASSLGSLSGITGTTATITTNSGSAGSSPWTLSYLTQSSSSQPWTYLAAPGTPSVSPTSGASNVTTAATFTSTNLPFGFTGVPFSITVGGGAVTGLSATASTTATGTIPTGTIGAADVVVSVDGVTATGSGAYTYLSPATITSVTPNIGSAAGGWVIQIAGANLSAFTSVKINGVSCTGTSFAGGVITATTPSFGNANGSTTGQSIVVATPSGNATSSGVTQNYYYLPSNNTIAFAHRADALITIATGVSNQGDISGQSHPWVQATGGNQPTVAANYNGSGLPSLAFTNAASSGMSMTSIGSTLSSGIATIYVVGTYGATTVGRALLKLAGASGNNYLMLTGTSGHYVLQDSAGSQANSGSTVDLNAHVYSAFGDLANSWVQIDSTRTAGTLTTALASLNTTNWLGQIAGGTDCLTGNIAFDIVYSGTLSTGDDSTIRGILKAIYGTP
jgi:hypothetical protein